MSETSSSTTSFPPKQSPSKKQKRRQKSNHRRNDSQNGSQNMLLDLTLHDDDDDHHNDDDIPSPLCDVVSKRSKTTTTTSKRKKQKDRTKIVAKDHSTDRKRNNNRRHSRPKPEQDDTARQECSHQKHKKKQQLKSNQETCNAKKDDDNSTLIWKSSNILIPLSTEHLLLPHLLHWKTTERGMMKDQPPFRLERIQKLCKIHTMELNQALSLRRHALKQNHPKKDYSQLGLGKKEDIRHSARLFEDAVERFLDSRGMEYCTEQEQRKIQGGYPLLPTPDFVLKAPICLCTEITYQRICADSSKLKSETRSVQQTIYWIEAKMFYGASSIPRDDVSAVGRILLTAEKYVKLYGPGAMVFMYGCGEELAVELWGKGVVVLDAKPLDLERVESHQRVWCGDEKGRILP